MCPDCEGTGQCAWCHGVGIITPTAPDSGAPYPCPHCQRPGADGAAGDGLCARCGGKGVAPT